MKKKTRILSVLLAASVAAGLMGGCTANKESEKDILAERRNKAEAYMRSMATVMWRAQEDVVYTITSEADPQTVDAKQQIHIKAGSLYRGIPYSYAMGSMLTFLDYAGEPDSKGVRPVSGLTWQALSGSGTKRSRVGNDCSSAVILSWSQIGGSVKPTSTQYMCPDNGYLRVGEYKSNAAENQTMIDCVSNGAATMYNAYAQLQKADAVVRRGDSSGHTMMIVSVDVVTREDGSVNGSKSKVTVLEQTRSHIRSGANYYDEAYGENVYITYGVDVEYSFQDLFGSGYLPITCRELIDPAPVESPVIADSETAYTRENLIKGTLTSKWFIDAVTVTVTDGQGNPVQEATVKATRGKNREFDLNKFVTDHENTVIGSLQPEKLKTGSYHCKLVCRMTTGQMITVRDFDFTV